MDLMDLMLGIAYGGAAFCFFITARRRVAYRSGHDLNWTLAVLWAVLWPIWTALWLTAALALPFEKRPASLLRKPSKADRAARALDQRRAEREKAIEDWENRAAFWYAEGERAEAEDNQALKRLVADQLNFLLETHPDGPQAPKAKADQRAVESQKARDVIAPVRSGEVGYCNVCARNRDRGALMMEGVCRECSEQQGLN